MGDQVAGLPEGTFSGSIDFQNAFALGGISTESSLARGESPRKPVPSRVPTSVAVICESKLRRIDAGGSDAGGAPSKTYGLFVHPLGHRGRRRILCAAPLFVWQRPHDQNEASAVCRLRVAEPRFVPSLSIQRCGLDVHVFL